jgi:aerobic-type carbon monoxide dehydrogenase small subunit (CoxS/CutS family)
VTVEIGLEVNGVARSVETEPRKTLADVLREDLGLHGTHLGCEHGVCDDAELKELLSSNLCRCTGYTSILEAVKQAAAELRD